MSGQGDKGFDARALADACERMAVEASRSNRPDAARILLRAAAEIDLTDAALQQGWGGPLNGQRARQRTVAAIIDSFNPVAIVETGTHRAVTTLWFAERFKGRIFTCERAQRLFIQSAIKLKPHAHVRIANADSRAFLKELCAKRIGGVPVLFYLDAHSGDDLPFAEELSAILDRPGSSIVLIDDFAVPHDPGYGFDDYGSGKRLDLDYLAPFRARLAAVCFPSTPSAQETGVRRGFCALATDDLAATALAMVEGLRAIG
jgi:predicted O-methyltransferase YrrM